MYKHIICIWYMLCYNIFDYTLLRNNRHSVWNFIFFIINHLFKILFFIKIQRYLFEKKKNKRIPQSYSYTILISFHIIYDDWWVLSSENGCLEVCILVFEQSWKPNRDIHRRARSKCVSVDNFKVFAYSNHSICIYVTSEPAG